MDSSKILIIVIVAIVSIALFFLVLYFVSFTLKKKGRQHLLEKKI